MKKFKSARSIIALVIIVGLGVFYFYYLSNKTPSKDATDQTVTNNLVAEMTTKDIMNNYPQSPRELVKLYTKISVAYYKDPLTDEQIEQLGRQARLLFDDELKATQTEEDFLNALKQEIKNYRAANRFISEYKLQSSADVKYSTLNGRKYASFITLYYVREGKSLVNSYTKYVMRKDNNNQWKILYWELADVDDLD